MFAQRHPIGDLVLLLSADQRRVGVQRPPAPPVWGPPLPLPSPVRLVLREEDVAYHLLWSGISEVQPPRHLPDGRLCCWLVDGEEQLLMISVTEAGTVTLE